MQGVVVRVAIPDFEASRKVLVDQVVPRVSQLPGFVAGYWLKAGDHSGLSIVVFESEETARTAAGVVRENAPETVTVESVEVLDVVASA